MVNFLVLNLNFIAKMHVIASFTFFLSSSISVLVGAIPQHQQGGDPVCVDQTTITVTAAPAVSGPTKLPDVNGQADGAEKFATVTVVRTINAVPEQYFKPGITETVTITTTEVVTTTETSTVTVQPASETEIPDATTEPQEASVSWAAGPSPTIVHPHYVNGTQPAPYGNSSLPSNTSSYDLPTSPILPKPSSISTDNPSSGYVLPPSLGYENSLYFTNWSVAPWEITPPPHSYT
jgi:hypothetical protein